MVLICYMTEMTVETRISIHLLGLVYLVKLFSLDEAFEKQDIIEKALLSLRGSMIIDIGVVLLGVFKCMYFRNIE